MWDKDIADARERENMKLKEALQHLIDNGHGKEPVSVYIERGRGAMARVEDSLSGKGRFGKEIAAWHDCSIIYEPYIEQDTRWVLCIGIKDAGKGEVKWDGPWNEEEFRRERAK